MTIVRRIADRARRCWLAVAVLFAITPAAAQPPAPKLLVVISVDQFSADLFAEYRARFTQGLKRLAGGAVFPSGFQSHAATETCPGHSTILTGDRPARTGIIANYWFDLDLARADKRVYCAEDPSAPGSSSEHYVPSDALLKVPTLGDRLKQVRPATRVIAVAGKDRAAIMMGGHRTDQLWFWNGKGFATLAGPTGPAPAAVYQANRRAAAALAHVDAQPLPVACRPLALSVTVGDHTLGRLQRRAAGDERGYRATPAFDRSVAGLAEELLRELRLGQGEVTDLLIVGLSATDYVGHAYGTEGAEMCAQLMALDATLGRFLKALDATGARYAVALTADHGGHDMPERNRLRAMPDAHPADPALWPVAVSAALAGEFGLSGTPLAGDGPFGDMYLGRDVPAAVRPRLLAAARERFRRNPDVAAVFTADELRSVPASGLPVDLWTLSERFAASFDPSRSGDLLVALKPRVVPVLRPLGTTATHGSPWNYDRRVPILFWWRGITGFEQPNPIETVDLMPSLAALVGVSLAPGEVDGRCLDLDAGAGSTCPPAPARR